MTKDAGGGGLFSRLIGKKVVVGVDLAAGAGGGLISTPAPASSGRGLPPYVGDPKQYRSYGPSESAWVSPENAPHMVRNAWVMLGLMLPQGAWARGGPMIRHIIRQDEPVRGLHRETWTVRANLYAPWQHFSDGQVGVTWSWRPNEWTSTVISETRIGYAGRYEEHTHWMVRVGVAESNDANYHLWRMTEMLDFFAEKE